MIKRIGFDVNREEQGFTLVELMIVMIVSLIMMVGMIGLLYMGFNSFKKHRDLNALTDSSRRVLQMMSRELRSNLQFVNEECSDTQLEFYADIDADNPGRHRGAGELRGRGEDYADAGGLHRVPDHL